MNEINTKIAGISLHQDAIKSVKALDYLVLKREPCCQFDINAVKVLTKEGTELGYLKKTVAFDIAPIIDAEVTVLCQVTQVTGLSNKIQGINIILRYSA
ncbi:MAG: HIRAN domain-containing protein [archaeon]